MKTEDTPHQNKRIERKLAIFRVERSLNKEGLTKKRKLSITQNSMFIYKLSPS